ncbi:hypothetical protein, partial [Brachybacterium muris]
ARSAVPKSKIRWLPRLRILTESQARAVVAVDATQEEALRALAAEHGVPVARIGATGGDELEIDGVASFPVTELRDLREGTLPRHFG